MALTEEEERFFREERELHEDLYLRGADPRRQSGCGRDEPYWERYRRPVAAPIRKDGTYLDIGCANGLLMESVARWAAADGYRIEPYGLDISAKLAALARERLPRWRDRIFVGNALLWPSPIRFDYVRTELVYVPPPLRRRYVERLLREIVAPDGRLIACSYGSSRPEGARAEPLIGELEAWGFSIEAVHDAVSPEHGFVVTRAASIAP